MNELVNNSRPRRCRRSLVAPLVLIGLGVAFLLDQYHVYPIDRTFAFFWPAVLILFGLELLTRRHGRANVLGLLVIAVGGLWIARNLDLVPFDVANLWPLALIAFGIALLVQAPGRRVRVEGYDGVAPGSESAEDALDGQAVLGGVNRRVTSQNFRGGSLTAIFGGFNVDLTRANIAGDSATLNVSALFGGGEIRVPETWIIDVQGQAILGGYSDETHQAPPLASAKRLIIQGTAIFGGVAIKN